MKDWPTHDYPGGNPMLHANTDEADADAPTPCTCTIACIPQGITEEQTCRLTIDDA